MLSAVDRAAGRRVSPGEVLTTTNHAWDLHCPICGDKVHVVQNRHPYFAHRIGVPAYKCELRNTHHSGTPRPVLVRKEWVCPSCAEIADEEEAAECVSCNVKACADCSHLCEGCGESVCDECDHGEWTCATCDQNYCNDAEEGGRDDQYECACGEWHCEACVHQTLQPCTVCKAKTCSNEECYMCGACVCGNCFPKHEEADLLIY